MHKGKYLPDNIKASDRLIVALDFDTEADAENLVNALGETVCFYKVGWQLFLGAGWSVLRFLLDNKKKVFLDLKINDIEATVRSAINNIPKGISGNIELLTIHGNGPTVKAAKAGRNGNAKPYLLMITALSSMDDSDIRDIYLTSDEHITTSAIVKLRAERALEAGCEGLIASGESVKELRESFKDRDFIIVTPGIRPVGAGKDDHKRSLTPYEAIQSGSDYIVVGRPITRSDNPLKTAKEIISDIDKALTGTEANSSTPSHESGSQIKDNNFKEPLINS